MTLALTYLSLLYVVNAQVDLCQRLCVDPDRITGPTREDYSLGANEMIPGQVFDAQKTRARDHPWKLSQYPVKQDAFCKLGCQLFFTEVPKNTTCMRLCDYFYRFDTVTGYSDLMKNARLECRDGCDIALQVCDAGYYCNEGEMKPCEIGTFREPIDDISIIELNKARVCDPCPAGRYRTLKKGKSPDDCSLCPIGKYAATIGNTDSTKCIRCPAGKNAEQKGMAECKCITDMSCDYENDGVVYFNAEKNEDNEHIDFLRETLPFIGTS